MSKHQLLRTWPDPLIVRDIASLIGFAIFYSSFIPHFEVRAKRLREITKLVYLEPVAPHFDEAARAEWEDIKCALLSDHCMMRFDYRKRLFLRTDFSALSFGYATTQPADDKESLLAMQREMAGAPCEFMKKGSKLKLLPVSLGRRKTCGNETRLHSYLGKGYAGNWAINKCYHMCWGMRFT